MKVSQITQSGQGAWPSLLLDDIHSQLSVFFGLPQSGKSTLAQLASHLLYGKESSTWRQQFGHSIPRTEGTLTVQNGTNSYTLRRQYESDPNLPARLTISGTDGSVVDKSTIQAFFSELTPDLASQLFTVDFAVPPRIDQLLVSEFQSELIKQVPQKSKTYATSRSCCNGPTEYTWTNDVDHRRVEELIQQRDAIAQEIENQVGVRRRESLTLEKEISDLQLSRESKRNRLVELQSLVGKLDKEIAELETRYRYHSLKLESLGSRVENPVELESLDLEIESCRRSLADAQTREKTIRTELSLISPDGTADRVTSLADSRVTLAVVEQLLDDLDTEVAQLARSEHPNRCVGLESHARLTPVADLLRQQVYVLCGQITEQERSLQRQHLSTELQHLLRIQSDLGDRLEVLHSRRESIIQSNQSLGRKYFFPAQAPVNEHCQCEHHVDFAKLNKSYYGNEKYDPNLQSHLQQLQRDRSALIEEIDGLQQELTLLETNWKALQSQRAQLLGGSIVEKNQAELERLEGMIQELLNSEGAIYETPGKWRASDILAQLTDGQLVQIRLEQNGSQITIIDRAGRGIQLENLKTSQHDQLYVAITLALVSSYAQRGIKLPLILDEPFLRQDTTEAAIMAGVLDEFARDGHQLLIFTEDLEARRKFQTLGNKIYQLEEFRTAAPAPIITTKVTAPVVQTSYKTNTKIVRQTAGGTTSPGLRLAEIDVDDDKADVFYLTESSSWEEFPVLGENTTSLFVAIGIHSVGELLTAEPENVANLLNRPDITVETVLLWQSHMALMCYVPGLTLNDAQLMTAIGIDSPYDLFEADIEALALSANDFLSSDRGQRFASARSRYGSAQWSSWKQGARRYRNRWQQSRSRFWRERTRRGASSRRSTNRSNSSTKQRSQRTTERKSDSQRSRSVARTTREWRFTLSRQDDVEDAPSIGPKTADRLAKVGIRSVADLLNANPESAADEIEASHITANLIADWQQQARLVCQIPDLPGYGAQLLVASGFTEPEQIAETSSEDLVAKVQAFCQTKKGQRILRSGEAPEADKIASWIECALNSRSLDAA